MMSPNSCALDVAESMNKLRISVNVYLFINPVLKSKKTKNIELIIS